MSRSLPIWSRQEPRSDAPLRFRLFHVCIVPNVLIRLGIFSSGVRRMLRAPVFLCRDACGTAGEWGGGACVVRVSREEFEDFVWQTFYILLELLNISLTKKIYRCVWIGEGLICDQCPFFQHAGNEWQKHACNWFPVVWTTFCLLTLVVPNQNTEPSNHPNLTAL